MVQISHYSRLAILDFFDLSVVTINLCGSSVVLVLQMSMKSFLTELVDLSGSRYSNDGTMTGRIEIYSDGGLGNYLWFLWYCHRDECVLFVQFHLVDLGELLIEWKMELQAWNVNFPITILNMMTRNNQVDSRHLFNFSIPSILSQNLTGNGGLQTNMFYEGCRRVEFVADSKFSDLPSFSELRSEISTMFNRIS